MSDDLAAAFAATDLFGSLGRRPLSRLAAAARVVEHPAGRTIVDEGESGIGFHLILDGTAEVKVGDEGRPDLGPGDYFGEISLVDGKPRSATVVAKTALRTASLTHWQAKPLFMEEPEVTWALLSKLCERLRAAERH